MTEQEKQLLLKDLCARLPYGVVVYDEYTCDRGRVTFVCKDYLEIEVWPVYNQVQWNMARPYLRPMSSMTEEEKSYFHNFKYWILKGDVENCTIHMVDWLNAHHFDYRGLIEKDMALEAPEVMYRN